MGSPHGTGINAIGSQLSLYCETRCWSGWVGGTDEGEQAHPILTDPPVTGQTQTGTSTQDTPAGGHRFWEENQAGPGRRRQQGKETIPDPQSRKVTSEWRLESGEPCEYADGEAPPGHGGSRCQGRVAGGAWHTEECPRGWAGGARGSLVGSRGGEVSAGLSWDPEAT